MSAFTVYSLSFGVKVLNKFEVLKRANQEREETTLAVDGIAVQ